MKTFYRTLAAFLLIALAFVPNANSYGVTTHAAISVNAWQAAMNVQKNFFQALQFDTPQLFGPVAASPPAGTGPFTAKGWIIAGSQYEDDQPLPVFINTVPAARVLFHFFDPYYNRGLSLLPFVGLTSTSSDWGVFGIGSSLVCPLPPACLPISTNNDFPYASTDPAKDARVHFYNGLTNPDAATRNQEFGAMFRTLGQVIHLLQDTAQPQHARNDFHLDLGATPLAFLPASLQRPSAYERYVDARTDLQTLSGTGAAISFSLPQFFFANSAGSGLAQFTNSNFVSAGTNCTNTITCNAVGNYPAPSMTGGPTNMLYKGGVLTFYANQVYDRYTNTTTQNTRMTTDSLFDADLLATGNNPLFTLNHFNYEAQAGILIPKAVDYSAALLNYFFRGSLTTQRVNGGLTITNTSQEDMDGTFSMYYDDTNGVRHSVAGATWQLAIGQGTTSAALALTAPTSPAPKVPGQYTLVFHGKLGSEDGAVAGALVTLQNIALNVSVFGVGSISIVPPGTTCTTNCIVPITAPQVLTLTATPGPNYAFQGWSVPCGFANQPPTSLSPTITITVTSTTSACARFTIPTTATVTSVECTQTGIDPTTIIVSAAGTITGPGGLTAQVQAFGGPPGPYNPNLLTFGDHTLLSFDCGAWTPDLGTLTCQQPAGDPVQTTWQTSEKFLWYTAFGNFMQFYGSGSVLYFPNHVATSLASKSVTCTVQ